MKRVKIFLTFDLDPPTFSKELDLVYPENYSNGEAIFKLWRTISRLESKLNKKIPITIFLRNLTIDTNSFYAHSIQEELSIIKKSDFEHVSVGLHPHINTCLANNFKLFYKLRRKLRLDFNLMNKNGFSTRFIRFGGMYYCESINSILHGAKIEINSSEIYGRNFREIEHTLECRNLETLEFYQTNILAVPISTSILNIDGISKRVYFDFSFKNNYVRSMETLNMINGYDSLVAISHPATFFKNIYSQSSKYEFGIDYWVENFLETYKILSSLYEKIDFYDFSEIKNYHR